MKLPDSLCCLYSAQLKQRNGSYVFEVPEDEVQLGEINHGEIYRVALLSSSQNPSEGRSATEENPRKDSSGPPVEQGEIREVEIETLGDQGDGIARIEYGYVVIVPNTEIGETVSVEITEVKDNVGFGEVIERKGGNELTSSSA